MENKITSVRKQKKLTQEDLAIAAKVSRQHICRIEKGNVVCSLKVASAIAKKLDVEIEDIFFNISGN